MNQSNVTELPSLPSIEAVYEHIHGEPLEGDGDERRGFCLSVNHPDGNPSCDYNVAKNVYHCKSCEVFGGVLSLIVDAGKAPNTKQARTWCRENGLLAKSERASQSVWKSVDAVYPYTDGEGILLYEVGRWNLPNGGKQFRQRVRGKEGNGALKGVERVPYSLPALRAAIAAGGEPTAFVVEGEKDADNLIRLGALATTNAQGAKWDWPVAWAEKYFRGFAIVYVLADNDMDGREAALKRAQLIATVVPLVKVILKLPGVGGKGDVSDWFELPGSDLAALLEICENNGEVAQPYVAPYDVDALDGLASDQSDIGAGRWFNAHYGDVARFIIEAKVWYTYADGVWGLDDPSAALYGVRAADLIQVAAADYSGQFEDDFTKFAESVRALSKRKAMIESAQPENRDKIGVFDAHPTFYNCANGTVDLDTGRLMDHDPADMLTLQTPVAYDPAAMCPKFERWLTDCVGGDHVLFEYMQQVMGSCLEGRPGLRSFYFIFGPKGTGKSTFVRILEGLLGPYQTATDFNALTESRFGSDGAGATPQLAALRGKRMVSAAESRGNAKLDAARVKQLIGGDKVSARFLHQNLFEFRFEATLIMSGNEMPHIVGDESIWDKFKPVPFLHEIADEDPEFEKRELLPELSGILNFALEGLRKLRASGYRMVEPQAVTDARNTERAEQDTFKDFLGAHVVSAPGAASVPGAKLRELYNKWAMRSGSQKLLPKQIKTAMVRHGFKPVMPQNVLHWKDVKLIDPDGGAPPPY